MEISLNVASHEVGRRNEIRGADREVAEAEVRAGEAARLLGVVGEVCLTVFVGVVADDLDGVLVGSDCAISAKTEELGLEHSLVAYADFGKLGKGKVSHVVDDAHREAVLGLGKSEIVIDGKNLCGSGVLRAEAIATAYDERGVLLAVEAILYVEIERLSERSGFFRAVEHGDSLGRGGDGGKEVLCGERTIEVNAYETNFLPFCAEMVNGLADALRDGTHGDDHAVGLGVAIVVKQTVVAARDF